MVLRVQGTVNIEMTPQSGAWARLGSVTDAKPASWDGQVPSGSQARIPTN